MHGRIYMKIGFILKKINIKFEKDEINNMSYNLGRDELFWRIGHENTDKLLEDITLYANVDFVYEIGRTYLHVACSAHNLAVVRLLLQKGADPNCKDKEGHSPILSAIGRIDEDNPEFLRIFLEYGLDLNEDVNGLSLKEVIESFEEEELNKVITEFEIKNHA